MKNSINHSSWTLIAALVVCLGIALPAMAQGPGGRGFGLDGLKNALQTAGATALTSAQESSVSSLITSFRASQTPPSPNSAVESARVIYDKAILAGQKDAALAQIPTIANEMASNAAARMKETAGFAISVIQVLDAAQLDLLVKQFGTSGVVRLIESLAGGPGPGGGRGQGPMGMRPPGV